MKKVSNSKNYNIEARKETPIAAYIALAVSVGAVGYLAWNNRRKIQKYLYTIGVDTPAIASNISNAVKTGVSRIASTFE